MPDCGFLEDLALDGEVSFEDGDRGSHKADWGTEQLGGKKPDAVVWPAHTEDVATVLAAADDRGVPVTPYAAGTGLEGNAVPMGAGVSLDMTRMNDVLEVRPDDFQIDVEPGVFGDAVNEAVEKHGLFFPPLPSSGSISTIGGMVANDAGGMQTVKYGKVGDWVMELEWVTADGRVAEAGSKAVKSSSGYNLKDLLVGSEGTLGVVTRATLELKGLPEQIRGGRAIFPTVDDAAAAVSDAVRSEVDVAKIELIDDTSAMMANDYMDADLPDSPMVFLEYHANHGIQNEIDFTEQIFEAHDVERFEIEDEETMDELWQTRRELGYAVRSWEGLLPVHPGDITVPLSRYPDIVRYIQEKSEESDLLIPCFGHAGDGNVHYVVLVDYADDAMLERGREVYDDIVQTAIDWGGTATGEHGIGLGKRKWLVKEHGAAGVEAMRAVKDALDPNGTLNPGKIFPDEAEEYALFGDQTT